MKFPGTNGGGGGTGTAEQTLEETQRWAKLVRWFEKNGGEGVALDFHTRIVGVKREHEVLRYDTATQTRVLQYWGKDTPIDKRVIARQKKDGTEYEGQMTEGCLITLELVDPKYRGLRFYLDCAYSDFQTATLVKLVSAVFRGKVGEDDDVDPVEDLPGKEVMATIAMGKERTATCVDGSPVKGGYWWNVKSSFKPVPVADDDEDDDFPTPKVGTKKEDRLSSRSASLAPAERELAGVGAAQAQREIFDDDEAPF